MTLPKHARPILERVVAEQPYPLLFATVSGAHHYGFPSPDSDFDLRGVHILPAKEVVGLEETRDTIEISEIRDGIELDLVTHDVRKFFELLLKKNGYVLEQLLSPIVISAAPEAAELRELSKKCITKHHAHHYLGFAQTQWGLFKNENPPRVKPLLYVYRVLLTGIHLMRTGELQANLVALNEDFKLAWLGELIDAKVRGEEKVRAKDIDVAFHEKEYERLRALLEESSAASFLRKFPPHVLSSATSSSACVSASDERGRPAAGRGPARLPRTPSTARRNPTPTPRTAPLTSTPKSSASSAI